VEIKPQNLSKMSKDQLIKLLSQKETSAEDRAKVKSELVRRESDRLYNESLRKKPGDNSPSTPLKPVSGQPQPPAGKSLGIGPNAARGRRALMMAILVILVIVLSFVIYSAVIR
jgi:hypothetical protein